MRESGEKAEEKEREGCGKKDKYVIERRQRRGGVILDVYVVHVCVHEENSRGSLAAR